MPALSSPEILPRHLNRDRFPVTPRMLPNSQLSQLIGLQWCLLKNDGTPIQTWRSFWKLSVDLGRCCFPKSSSAFWNSTGGDAWALMHPWKIVPFSMLPCLLAALEIFHPHFQNNWHRKTDQWHWGGKDVHGAEAHPKRSPRLFFEKILDQTIRKAHGAISPETQREQLQNSLWWIFRSSNAHGSICSRRDRELQFVSISKFKCNGAIRN